MVEVKHATRDDMKALAVIQTSSWKGAFKDILNKDTLERYTDLEKCQMMLEKVYDSKRGFFYIGYYKGKPCAELFWCEGKEMIESAEIVALHSIPECWGHGVGKEIIDKAIDEIKAKGYKNIYLWVFEENIRAIKFYEKEGFVLDGENHVSDFDEAVEVRYVYSIC